MGFPIQKARGSYNVKKKKTGYGNFCFFKNTPEVVKIYFFQRTGVKFHYFFFTSSHSIVLKQGD